MLRSQWRKYKGGRAVLDISFKLGRRKLILFTVENGDGIPTRRDQIFTTQYLSLPMYEIFFRV